jgi:hypothetical protein
MKDVKPTIISNHGYEGALTEIDLILEPVCDIISLDYWIKRLVYTETPYALVKYPDGQYSIMVKSGELNGFEFNMYNKKDQRP